MNLPSIYKKSLDELYASIGSVNDLANWRTVIDLWRGTSNSNVIKCYIAPWGYDYEIPKTLITSANIDNFRGKALYVSLDKNAEFKSEMVTDNHLNYYVIDTTIDVYANNAYIEGMYGDGSRNHPFLSINQARLYLSNYRSTGTVNFEIVALIKDGNTKFVVKTYQYLSHPDATGLQGSDGGWLILKTAPFFVKGDDGKDTTVENVNDSNPTFEKATFDFQFVDTLLHNRWNALIITGASVRMEDIELKYTYLNSEDYIHPSGTTINSAQHRNWWQRSIGINVRDNASLRTDNVYVTGFCTGIYLNVADITIYNDLIIDGIPIAPCQTGYNTEVPPFATAPSYKSDGTVGEHDSFSEYSNGIQLETGSRLQTSNHSRSATRYRRTKITDETTGEVTGYTGNATLILIRNVYRGLCVTSSDVSSWVPATGTDPNTMQQLYEDPVKWVFTNCFIGVGIYGNASTIRSVFPYWIGPSGTKYGHGLIATGFVNSSLAYDSNYYPHLERTFPGRYTFMGLFQMGSIAPSGYYLPANATCEVDDFGNPIYTKNTDPNSLFEFNELEVFSTNVSWKQYINNIEKIPQQPSTTDSYFY